MSRCFDNRPANFTLKPCVYRDTWDGVTFSFTSDGFAFSSSLTSARMSFVSSSGDVIGLALTSDPANGITITNANPNAWVITVEGRSMSLTPGTWSWALETTDAAGIVKTRIVGTINILTDATA